MRQKESQKVQREAALARHEQLDAMLRRQTENRIQMQAIISAHQERITQRIRVRKVFQIVFINSVRVSYELKVVSFKLCIFFWQFFFDSYIIYVVIRASLLYNVFI